MGNEVRAHVSDAEADRAEAALGYHSTTFEGEVLERDTSGALLMRVPGSVFSSSGQTERYFQRLRLMPADVVGLQARRLSLTRTGTLVGAGVVAAVIILKSVFTGSGGSLPPSGGGTGTLHNVVTPQG